MNIYVYVHILLFLKGEDRSVFFLKIGESIEPIGFIIMPARITHLTWSPESHVRK